MKNITFRRAKNDPSKSGLCHPESIVEAFDSALFPDRVFQFADGYEILDEESFSKELDRNSARLEVFLSEKRELEAALRESRASEHQKRLAEAKATEREFAEFLRWKKNKK